MSCCPAFEPLLLERASGTIEDDAGARLAVHLRACPGCREEAAALEGVLALVRLPPERDAERAALAGLAGAVQRELRAGRGPSPWHLGRSTWLAGGAAAAAALLAAAYPLLAHRPARGGPTTLATLPAAPSWEEPDPDELLEAADFEDDGADAAAAGADELALLAATADDLAEP